MKVILNADDFGFDKDTTQATIECFERGALTSATIMVNCAASQLAMRYAASHPQFSFGVHLTYVDGLKPVAPATDIKGLIDNKGLFLESNDVRKRATMMKLPKTSIIAESLAQIKLLEDSGVKIANVDSHGHLHKFPSFLLALKSISKNYRPGLNVRTVQNVFMQPHKSTNSLVTILNSLFCRFIEENFKTTNYFYMAANSFDTNWGENILAQLDKIGSGTIEIGVHPGHNEEWRQNEFDDICHFAYLLRKSRHQLINWNEI